MEESFFLMSSKEEEIQEGKMTRAGPKKAMGWFVARGKKPLFLSRVPSLILLECNLNVFTSSRTDGRTGGEYAYAITGCARTHVCVCETACVCAQVLNPFVLQIQKETSLKRKKCPALHSTLFFRQDMQT
jgi:hypothetical protein